MYIVQQEISKSPSNGLRRVARVTKFNWLAPLGHIAIEVTVFYLDNEGEAITTGERSPYVRVLTIDNSQRVDGSGVDIASGGIGKYDFYFAAVNGNANFFDLLRAGILQTDLNGRYD